MTGKTDLLGPLERSLQVFLRDEGVLLGVLEAWEGWTTSSLTHTRARTHTDVHANINNIHTHMYEHTVTVQAKVQIAIYTGYMYYTSQLKQIAMPQAISIYIL